jgi:hypothetical protein
MLRVYGTRTMLDKPKVGRMFRVGPYVGVCVWNFLGFAVMKTR